MRLKNVKIFLFKIVLLINEDEPIMGFKIKPIYLLLNTVREFSLPEFASTQNFGFYSEKKITTINNEKKLMFKALVCEHTLHKKDVPPSA